MIKEVALAEAAQQLRQLSCSKGGGASKLDFSIHMAAIMVQKYGAGYLQECWSTRLRTKTSSLEDLSIARECCYSATEPSKRTRTKFS